MASDKGARAADHGTLLALLAGMVDQPVQLQLTDRPTPVSGVLVAVSPGGVVLQQEQSLLAVRPDLVVSAQERRAGATETLRPPVADTQKAAGNAPTATAAFHMPALPIQGGEPDPDEPLPDLVAAEDLLPTPPAAVPPPPRVHQFPRLWEPDRPTLRRFRRPL